tara:strand:+ start:711 stop:929 length:219 start_codon:yes stop_codon:yes gene_type:complete
MDIKTKLENLENALATAESILTNLHAEENKFVHATQLAVTKDLESDIVCINRCFARIRYEWKDIDADNFGEV